MHADVINSNGWQWALHPFCQACLR
jgi:hypothetical protein